MNITKTAALAAFCLLLTACAAKKPPAAPTELPGETASAAPQEPAPDLQETSAVETDGAVEFQVGDFWVTAEPEETDETTELWDSNAKLTIRDRDRSAEPLQTIHVKSSVYGWYNVVDANFDGYPDFGWMYAMGNQPCYWYYWIWDETQQRFVEEPEFSRISWPTFDAETETVTGFARNSGAGSGVHTYHQWIDGALACVRRVEVSVAAEGTYLLEVYQRPEGGGDPVEIYSTEFQTGDFDMKVNPWLDLSYQGETEES